jgi:hypothetical protein
VLRERLLNLLLCGKSSRKYMPIQFVCCGNARAFVGE